MFKELRRRVGDMEIEQLREEVRAQKGGGTCTAFASVVTQDIEHDAPWLFMRIYAGTGHGAAWAEDGMTTEMIIIDSLAGGPVSMLTGATGPDEDTWTYLS